MTSHGDHRRFTAFTLVELLAVVLVIVIMAGFVVGFAGYVQRRVANSRTRAELAALQMAIEQYKLDTGTYPPSTTIRSEAVTNNHMLYTALTGGSKQYIQFREEQLSGVIETNTPWAMYPFLSASSTYTNIIDPFSMSYNYFYSGTPKNNAVGYDLWSYGSDRRTGLGSGQNWDRDDITNWK